MDLQASGANWPSRKAAVAEAGMWEAVVSSAAAADGAADTAMPDLEAAAPRPLPTGHRIGKIRLIWSSGQVNSQPAADQLQALYSLTRQSATQSCFWIQAVSGVFEPSLAECGMRDWRFCLWPSAPQPWQLT
ncbi:hypothetical protein WJX74_002770 [Apatococcus lobatus]|uniref:Uncharacterized protein n=1 Tax=Apatococcus lobatus TaxID=904363 RepID=A0AAW1Q7A3_9CHLO